MVGLWACKLCNLSAQAGEGRYVPSATVRASSTGRPGYRRSVELLVWVEAWRNPQDFGRNLVALSWDDEEVSWSRGTPKSFIWMDILIYFHYKPSIWGYLHLWNPPWKLVAWSLSVEIVELEVDSSARPPPIRWLPWAAWSDRPLRRWRGADWPCCRLKADFGHSM